MSLKENYLKFAEKYGGPYTLIKFGIKRGLITSIMDGSDIGVSKAHEIAKILGITMEELYTGKKGGESKEENYTPEEQEYINKLIYILRGKEEDKKTITKTTLDIYGESFIKTKHHEVNLKKTKPA
jgi:hypothetical protein